MKSTLLYVSTLLTIIFLLSCNKFLDKKPDKSLAIPDSIEDLGMLMDSYDYMNNCLTSFQENSSDNYHVSDNSYQSMNQANRKIYIWEKTLDDLISDWSNPYRAVYNANVVLDKVADIPETETNKIRRNEVQGMAHFFRGYVFYHLANSFSSPYDSATADKTAGIPLRLSSNFNIPTTRSTIKETFDQIEKDLQEAALLLPTNPTFKNRPSKAAAYGGLSKLYLAARNYIKAGLYADSALQINSTLMDYNDLDTLALNPIGEFTPESILHMRGVPIPSAYRIDSNFYRSYSDSDLRKKIFFKINVDQSISCRSNYSGYGSYGFIFTGVATNDMYLIKAESLARAGKAIESMDVLNSLLMKRFVTGTFVPLQASTAEEALELILAERRKELIYTNSRWTDLRRLNKEPRYKVTLRRMINGVEYLLAPESPRYTFQIPVRIINETNISQNP
jgi:tetratricopeptide (TPR) repeat protein